MAKSVKPIDIKGEIKEQQHNKIHPGMKTMEFKLDGDMEGNEDKCHVGESFDQNYIQNDDHIDDGNRSDTKECSNDFRQCNSSSDDIFSHRDRSESCDKDNSIAYGM